MCPWRWLESPVRMGKSRDSIYGDGLFMGLSTTNCYPQILSTQSQFSQEIQFTYLGFPKNNIGLLAEASVFGGPPAS